MIVLSSPEAAGYSAPPTTSTSNDPAAMKQMFLQLLVSQIKNQNPLNPSDPAEFLSQLTQFTGVEQMLEMRQELEAIRALLELGVASAEPVAVSEPNT
jgi:flagellar basal-body rod modification protein FlgD